MRQVVVALCLGVTLFAGCMAGEDGGGPAVTDEADAWTIAADGTLGAPVANRTARYVYTGYSGAEPNIGITREGNIFVTANDKTLRSSDGGRTWMTVHEYNPVAGLVDRGTSDPMLFVDPVTDRIYVNHMIGLYCFSMMWSDDEGTNWFQRDWACDLPGVDHQKVAAGPYGVNAPVTRGTWTNPVGQKLPDQVETPVCNLHRNVTEPLPDLPVGVPCIPGNPAPLNPIYPSVLLLCYQRTGAAVAVTALTEVCDISYDGGLTYPVESVVFNGVVHECGGASGHPSVGPDGRIAIAIGWGCGPLIAVSEDSGLTWTVRPGPAEHGAGNSIDPDVAWGSDGSLYLLYNDADRMTRLARTRDLGQTWDSWNVTMPGVRSTIFHVATTGDDGRIALAYLGTDYVPDPSNETWGDWDRRPSSAPPNATWHLYIVTSDNATAEDPVFAVHKVTPDDDPVQVGCAWEGGGGGGARACRNMLDFIDSTMHPDGTFYVVYTEGCTVRRECAGNFTADGMPPEEMKSRDREVAVAWLEGWSLLRRPNPVPAGRSATDAGDA